MIKNIQHIDYVILLCDDFAGMKAFYQDLFGFSVATEREDVLAMSVGAMMFCLRKRTRHYDGTSPGVQHPGVQIAFRVASGEVDLCYAELQSKGVTILDPPTDQFWGHRTVFFRDPEGNILEFYEELER
ncbi:MAG: VOC family protein [Planctomycetota bacterium]|nr:VOC family protein [Planctomycetota bacterium]MDA1211459.1 VOC family protein [Planctomycetota bacterium]